MEEYIIDREECARAYRISCIIGIPLLLAVIAFLAYYSMIKPLNIVASGNMDGTEFLESTNVDKVVLNQVFPRKDDSQSRFFIPLSEKVTQKDIRIENNYLARQMLIRISGMEEDFYNDTQMYGNLAGIESVQTGHHQDDVVVLIALNGIYEYEMILENQQLSLLLTKPGKVYDRIVVLDAAGYEAEEEAQLLSISPDEVTLSIAKKVEALLEQENVRVYMTRQDASFIATDDKGKLALDSDADLFLEIHLSDDPDYGIAGYYNDTYFTSKLTNVDFADELVRKTAQKVSGLGKGIYAANDNQLLMNMTMPAVMLGVGSVVNADEAKLLNREDYINDLAAGIAEGILEAFGKMESDND
ncbi:MAG: N-acetylmuramoyl-L-alanine amidase [Lachnospiraceae bacterium]|nr:N-acetylmuramoyl-L-alanine amidase [Candidatus Merdinaster equi]